MRSALSALATCVVLVLFTACPSPSPGPEPVADGGTGGGTGGSLDAGDLPTPFNQWTWVPVAGSKCASGATAGLGVNASGSTDLLIYFNGGGACWNTGTCVPSLIQFGPVCDYGTVCLLDVEGGQRPTAAHVSEADPYPADGGGAFPRDLDVLTKSLLLTRDQSQNPFRAMNYVFVPYCTGDLHSGATEKTYQYKLQLFDPVTDRTIHFAGATNVDAYLAWLVKSFPGTKRVFVTGSSAGGFGASLNLDRIARAFPNAEVHLLSDSGPLLETPHFVEWRNAWAMQFPKGCADCDAGGLPAISEHLATTYASSRQALLATEQDKVIAWYLYAPPGAGNVLNPPVDVYAARYAQLRARYGTHPNTKFFLAAGDSHVLLGGYGALQADGGFSAPLASRDAGVSLKDFVDGWGDGRPGWSSAP